MRILKSIQVNNEIMGMIKGSLMISIVGVKCAIGLGLEPKIKSISR